MKVFEKIVEIMFSGVPQFIGCFLVLALFLSIIEGMWTSFFDFLKIAFKKSEKNNFYISEKNINEKFLKELKEYGSKKRATE